MTGSSIVLALVALFGPAAMAGSSPVPVHFIRGDVNADGAPALDDAVGLLQFLFLDGAGGPCLKAADANDDGVVDLGDPVAILFFLFVTGITPRPPYPSCGTDPTDDGLPCGGHPVCEFETLISGYDLLVTVAGMGTYQDVNAWLSSYEGGPATEADLSNPHFSMDDALGNLYIADKEGHAIRKVTPDGMIHTVAGTGQQGNGDDAAGPATERALDSPNGLWVKEDSTVFIVDQGNGKVRRLDPSGSLTTLFTVPGGIAVGRGLWVREDEELAYFSSNLELKRWTKDGGVVVFASGFRSLGNIAMDPLGSLVATDRGWSQVFRIGADGTRTVIAGNGRTTGGGDGFPALDSAIYGVRGIWFLPGGGYFLATHEGGQVWYVDTRGIIHLFLNGRTNSHSGDGLHFRSPGFKVSEVRAVSVDHGGNVVITENDLGYVRRVLRR